MERQRDDMAARSAAWDQLRERRVLGRIEAELDAKLAQRSPARRRMALAISATMMMVAAALLVVWFARGPVDGLAPVLTPSLAGLELGAGAPAGTLALADGSHATLHDGALVEVRVTSDEEIGLEQIGGRVRYDVEPGLARAFSVTTGDVAIHVVGTAFWVEHEAMHVRVAVEHGRVRVAREGGTTVAELGPGEEVRVETGALAVAEPAPSSRPSGPETDAIELVDESAPLPRKARTGKPEPKPIVAATDEPQPSAAELQAQADAARRSGDPATAADALRSLIDRFPKDARVYSALFQLAKVERGRGRHAIAAGLFAAFVTRDPNGSLAEDARAEAAASWFSAGRHDDARAAADDYLARHPKGAHASRMQRLLQRLP